MLNHLLTAVLAVSPVVQPVMSGTFRDGGTAVSVRTQGNVLVQPSEYNSTLFGQARAVAPYTLADIIHTYGLDTETWGQQADAGGTVVSLPQEAAVMLSADGGVSTIMTHDRYRYQAGKAHLVLQTGMFVTPPDAGVARLGYFDAEDGLFWQYDYRGLGFVRRTSVSGTPVDNWTYVPMTNGFNPAMGNIYEIRMAWLGVHQVNGYLNGALAFSEVFDSKLPQVYMKTAYLPLRAETHGAAQLKHVCSSVQSEGGSTPTSRGWVVSSVEKSIASAAGFVPIISIRPAALINGEDNHAAIIPTNVTCAADGKRIRVRLRLNATLTNASFGATTPASGVEFDTAATAFSGGTEVCGFAVGDNSAGEHGLGHVFGELNRKLRVGAFGHVDSLTVMASVVSANSSVGCSIEWQEVR